jgi:hypothetical protein
MRGSKTPDEAAPAPVDDSKRFAHFLLTGSVSKAAAKRNEFHSTQTFFATVRRIADFVALPYGSQKRNEFRATVRMGDGMKRNQFPSAKILTRSPSDELPIQGDCHVSCRLVVRA